MQDIVTCFILPKPAGTSTGAGTKAGLFRRTTAGATSVRPSAASTAKPTTTTTTAPAVRTTKTSLTKPTASSAQKATDKGDKPLPQPPASRSMTMGSAREPPVPPKNTLPHPYRVTAPTAASANKADVARQRTSTAGSTSSTPLSGTSRAQAAVGVNKVNATGARSFSAGGGTTAATSASAPKSPTAVRMRASMTSGSIAGAAHTREVSGTKKRDEAFVVPSAATRTNSVASTSRVGPSATGRSSSAGGTLVARSMTARKNEMEIKVSPR